MNDLYFAFEAPKGTRFLRRGYRSISIEDGRRHLWWSYEYRRWVVGTSEDSLGRMGGSNCAPCRSFAAFKRHIRKHGKTLAGCRVVLFSRWVGHSVAVFVPH